MTSQGTVLPEGVRDISPPLLLLLLYLIGVCGVSSPIFELSKLPARTASYSFNDLTVTSCRQTLLNNLLRNLLRAHNLMEWSVMLYLNYLQSLPSILQAESASMLRQ